MPSTPPTRSSEAVSLLRLLQLFDSQCPIGAFAHSGGLETYAAEGAELPQVREVLEGHVALGWGRTDLAAAALAWHGADEAPRLSALAARVHALKIVPASRETSVRLGRRMRTLVRRIYPELTPGLDVEPAHHAVVAGVTGRLLGIDLPPLLLAFAHSLALGTVSAATRCMPISPAQAQTLLVALHGAIAEACARVERDPEASLFASTPALDIRAHQQAFLHTRLFQS